MPEEKQRRIVLVRHAKSDWPDVDDHDRPLAERGRKAAPAAGRWLADHGLTPDLALVSTAVRTRQTWALMAAELPTEPETVYDERLYDIGLGEQLIALLTETPDDVATLLVLGHNPVIHEAADTLAGEAEDDDQLARMQGRFPTAAIAVLAFRGSWRRVGPDAARLTAYRTPKDAA
ncbi:SixA phosphatase family protein [Kitasatospora sp. NPDC101155]|uniref:SixA phosphatase family protein n=1 Tax=Kitasatospora sp. NPDC101155 TaxID=3364097 RepID=UPI003802D61E